MLSKFKRDLAARRVHLRNEVAELQQLKTQVEEQTMKQATAIDLDILSAYGVERLSMRGSITEDGIREWAQAAAAEWAEYEGKVFDVDKLVQMTVLKARESNLLA